MQRVIQDNEYSTFDLVVRRGGRVVFFGLSPMSGREARIVATKQSAESAPYIFIHCLQCGWETQSIHSTVHKCEREGAIV